MEKKIPLRKKAVLFATAGRMVRVAALCLTGSLLSSEAFAQLEILKNVNTREEAMWNEYSYPVFTKSGSLFYYVSNMELWRSDGTKAGTYKLKAFRSVKNVTAIGSTVYFAADDGTKGLELWKSNGTVAGTVMVKDIYTGTTGSTPSGFTTVNSTVYFTARNSSNGQELWKTNGTAAGTMLVKDIINGTGSSNPGYLCALNSTTLLFVANDGQIGYELWKTDGTSAGTQVVKDVRTGAKLSSLPQYLTNVNGTVFFGAIDDISGRELWKTNGTANGTVKIKDIHTGTSGSNIENLVNLNGTLLFTAVDSDHGDELWKSDGTAAGTVLVKDMNPGPEGSNNLYDDGSGSPDMANFTIVNGLLYFTAAKHYTNYIYRTNGTESGTVTITEVPWSDNGGSLFPMPNFTYKDGLVYFFNYDYKPEEGFYRLALFKMPYNGTAITKVKEFGGDIALGMINHNGLLFLAAMPDDSRGYAIIQSNGTESGTVEFIDNLKKSLGSNPEQLFAHSGYVYFRANTQGFYGGSQEVWRTSGTPDGTIKLGTTDEAFPWLAAGSYVYFVSYNTTLQTWQLYRTNGTTGGTIVIKQGDPSQPYDWTRPKEMVEVSGKLYFSTQSGELWRYDPGTNAFKLLSTFYTIRKLYGISGRAYVVTYDGSVTWLYRADATGAYQVRSLNTGAPDHVAAHYPSVLYNNVFYFIAQDNTHGNEIWRTNGTASGTYMVQDMSTSDEVFLGGEWSVKHLFVHNNQLYATGIDNDRDTYLWKFNGSVFVKVKETDDVKLVSHNGLIYIWGRDVTDWRGNVLQVTDGSAAGFKTIGEFPDNNNDERVNLGIVDDIIFFNFDYMESLWRTDGTSCGTFFVDTHIPYTHEMQGLGTSLVFGGDVPDSGVEPYIYRNINSQITDNCASALAAEPSESRAVMTAYPNPSQDEFTLNFAGNENETADVVVFSSTGMPIEKLRDIKANTDYDHIGAKWPKGIYLVKISVAGKVTNHTIVKE
jgi:ELWxxDGT repeat protein